MRIQSNISAINTQRQMFKVNNAQSRALEKLSSGFRINRAADDAAGLAISEKMRSQIRGMKQASRNAQDGISVVQTAEGALDEVHSMLQRMKELAVQSANDSNQSIVDREALQLEVDALTDEINSITEKTQFNKMRLLDGSFKDKYFHVGANANETIGISIESMTAQGLGLNVGGKQVFETAFGVSRTINVSGYQEVTSAAEKIEKDEVVLTATDIEGIKVGENPDGTPLKAQFNAVINGKFAEFEVELDYVDDSKDYKIDKTKLLNAAKDALNTAYGSEAVVIEGDTLKANVEIPSENDVTGANIKISLENEHQMGLADQADLGISKADRVLGDEQAATANIAHEIGKSMIEVSLSGMEPKMINLTKDDDTEDKIKAKFQAAFGDKVEVSWTKPAGAAEQGIIKLTTKDKGPNVNLGVRVGSTSEEKAVVYKGVNILTREAANTSMTNIQDAIENLAARRAQLGAVQNRIEHTIANLDNSYENLTAAEARVRDTDMAAEIIESARTSILSQAAISMLSQANQVPQNVLSLLR